MPPRDPGDDFAIAGVVDNAPGPAVANVGAVVSVLGLRVLPLTGQHDVVRPWRVGVEDAIFLRHDFVDAPVVGVVSLRDTGRHRTCWRARGSGWTVDLTFGRSEAHAHRTHINVEIGVGSTDRTNDLKRPQWDRSVRGNKRHLAARMRTDGQERCGRVVAAVHIDTRDERACR